MSKLVTKKHPYADILKGSMAQAQNKNKKNPTHEKPVPATVLPNNLDTETKTSDVEVIKMSSPSMFFGHQFTHDQNMRFRLTKKTLTNSKKLCAKKYFGELEGFRLLTKIFHSRPPFLFTE
jgi:hypothetical protein